MAALGFDEGSLTFVLGFRFAKALTQHHSGNAPSMNQDAKPNPPSHAGSASRRALLLKALEHKAERAAEAGSARVSDSQPIPLSFAQEAFWLLHQLHEDDSARNRMVLVRLTGRLDRRAIGRSLDQIIRRHDGLRATFHSSEGVPHVVTAPVAPMALEQVNLEALPADDREGEAWRLVERAARVPFKLSDGPLYRGSLLRLSGDDHLLLLVIHHIVFDGWSAGVLIQELAQHYESCVSSGEPAVLPPLPMQYADFARGQRGGMNDQRFESQLQYWTGQLADAPELQLPVLKMPASRTPGGMATANLHLPLDLAARAGSLAREAGATLYMVLMAAFQAVLHRYTGQTDLCVASPVAGRTELKTEVLIGAFINTLMIRTRLDDDPTFRTLLGRVRDTTLGAYVHQQVPLETLLHRLRSQRGDGRLSPPRVMLNFRNYPRQPQVAGGVRMEELGYEPHLSELDLYLDVVDGADGLHLKLRGAPDLFDAGAMDRMLGHLGVFLKAALGQPDQALSILPLLTHAERSRLLVEWNATDAPFPNDRCIHHLFEAMVARAPEAVALVSELGQLSYGELNARANCLARRLNHAGVGPDSRVAIAARRSPDLIVGLLGILKAGAAYVPLDPDYPARRLVYMLADSGATVLLTQRAVRGALPDFDGLTLMLDDAPALVDESFEADPHFACTPANLAYVIYTSGSTGTPKGVMVEHGSLVNYLTGLVPLLDMRPADRVLQFSSINFDISVEEIFAPLVCGASLALRTDAMLASATAFVSQCDTWGVTQCHLPTAYWHQLAKALTEAKATPPTSLRLVVIGGERALPAVASAWQRFAGSRVRTVNTYGPTETTVAVTAFDLALYRDIDHGREEVPIGRPMINTRLHVLDPKLNPTPVGVPGELYIGGRGLARGYLGRPDLTMERFVPDRFASDSGARLYRSGDRARYLDDGSLEFLGRVDHQVKIHGFRIELGEVEAVLGRHPDLHQVVVLARTTESGELQLTAYMEPLRGRAPPAESLRGFLGEQLPQYMIPAKFVLLDALPLTPNGKIDRQALPEPDAQGAATENEYEAPSTPLELAVARIWAQVLGVDRVGRRDNFLALGGHSLLAAQVVGLVGNAVNLQLPMRLLLEAPTLADVCQTLESSGGAAEPAPIRRVVRTPPPAG